jgi:uncharacterized membrane protein
MKFKSWRAIGLVAFVGATAFFLGSLAVAYFLKRDLSTAVTVGLSGAVSFGIGYVLVQLWWRKHREN